jgi:lipid A ethanolaminephosphotransferase
MLMRLPLQRPVWPIALASAWMATVLNAPLWRELQSLGLLQRPAGWGLAAALAVILLGSLVALLSLLAWRGVLKPALVLLLVAAAAGSYFMLAYRVVIDSTMLTNVLQTDRHEAAALASPWLVAALVGLGLLPAWLLCRMPLNYARPWRQGLRNLGGAALALVAVALVVVVSFQPLASAMRNHKQLRYLLNPLNTVYALGQTVVRPLRQARALQPIGLDAVAATPAGRPPLLLLVLGETGRSGNFGLNGYARDTTPLLAREDVASWRNAWACGTSTAASVPCMYSHLGREGFEGRDADYETLLDVLQRAGLAVLWLDNQSGCKGVCDRVPHASTAQLQHPTLCPEGECLDAILLEGLDERIAALPAGQRARGVVLVLHQMGSHGPAYAQRSPAPAKRFLPECRSVNLQDCSQEELVNAYDNSIAYTDQVLASAIGWLRRHAGDYDGAMVYVADHGESLGENNLYLHGLPYSIAPDVQKRVPWITWLSPGFSGRTGVATECLRGLADAPVSHDNYFHGVLGLMQVRTSVYRRALDPYAACASH